MFAAMDHAMTGEISETEMPEANEDRFRGIIENALDIITLIEADGTIVYNSPAFGRKLGYEIWEALGQRFFDFIHDEDRIALEATVGALAGEDSAAAGGGGFRFRHKKGGGREF